MTAELIAALARANLAAGAAILAVLALRAPLRRRLGAERAYALWLIVPVAAAGALTPARLVSGAAGPIEATNDRALAWLGAGDHAAALALVWLSGVAMAIAIAAWRHGRFAAAMRAGRAGPAAVGVIRPRLVTPADFALRFTDAERALVRAHERAHVERLDARCNAAAALATWLCWFNPLAHLGARAMRLDQELACDAAVLRGSPGARRLYAETLLRTHPDAPAPLFGCQWAAHPLETRIAMLAAPAPSRARRDLGLAVLAGACAVAFAGAWALQPPARAIEPPSVVLVELAPPDATDATLGAALYQDRQRMRAAPHAARAGRR